MFSNNHEYILVYAKNPKLFSKTRNNLPLTNGILNRYKNPDNDPRGPWQSVSANVQAGHATPSQFYEIVAPNGSRHRPPNGRCWVYNEQRMKREIRENNIWFGLTGNNVPRIKRFLSDSKTGLTPETLWSAEFAGTNKIAKEHLLQLFPEEPPFDTPKPEQLIERIIQIATNQEDTVLDCFAGSGSTLSAAHKLRRKYIGIEIGDQATSVAARRLQKVIEGESGGISKQLGWTGGGSFKFYRLREQS